MLFSPRKSILSIAVAISLLCNLRVIEGADIIGLGDLSGGAFFSKPVAMTSDASVVIGTSETADGTKYFRWTAGSGMSEFSVPIPAPYTEFDISAIADDGTTVAGNFRRLSPENPNSLHEEEAFRWTISGGLELFGHLPNSYNKIDYVSGISRDGSIVVGGANNELGLTDPFVWTAQDGLQSIITGSDPDYYFATPNGVSGDGSTIVGRYRRQSVSGSAAFRWSADSGFELLGENADIASAVNNDGSVIAGRGGFPFPLRDIYKWTEDDGVVPFELSDIALARISRAESILAISDDGSRLVGDGENIFGNEVAAIWEGDEGGLTLDYILSQNGVDLTGWSELTRASHISADGEYILGYGIHNGNTEAFLVNLPSTALVPEPSSIVLGGFGFVVFCLIVQKRRKHIA